MTPFNKIKIKEQSQSEEESSDEKFESKIPFDIKSFWKNIDEKYFNSIENLNLNEGDHLIHLFSKYGN